MYFIPLNYDVIVSHAALTKIFSAYIPRSALSAFRDSPQVCFTDNTALKSVNCTKAQSIDSVSEVVTFVHRYQMCCCINLSSMRPS